MPCPLHYGSSARQEDDLCCWPSSPRMGPTRSSPLTLMNLRTAVSLSVQQRKFCYGCNVAEQDPKLRLVGASGRGQAKLSKDENQQPPASLEEDSKACQSPASPGKVVEEGNATSDTGGCSLTQQEPRALRSRTTSRLHKCHARHLLQGLGGSEGSPCPGIAKPPVRGSTSTAPWGQRHEAMAGRIESLVTKMRNWKHISQQSVA